MTLIFFSIWNLQIFTLSLILHLSWHHQEVARIQPLCKQATAWWIFFDKTFTKQKWSFNQAREALQGENIIISKSKKCRWCAAFFMIWSVCFTTFLLQHSIRNLPKSLCPNYLRQHRVPIYFAEPTLHMSAVAAIFTAGHVHTADYWAAHHAEHSRHSVYFSCLHYRQAVTVSWAVTKLAVKSCWTWSLWLPHQR